MEVSFTYYAVNSQNTASTGRRRRRVTFRAGNGITFKVVDAKDPALAITDYRWIIEEDRTVNIDPTTETSERHPAAGESGGQLPHQQPAGDCAGLHG